MSELTKAAKSSGVLGAGSAPCSASRCLASGSASTVLVSALIPATMSPGVPGGANKPNHPSD